MSINEPNRRSQSLFLAIRALQNEDPRLPGPRFLNARDGIIDLTDFEGDATITVDKWPLIAAGQTLWLELVGIMPDGSPVSFVLLDGQSINSEQAEYGVIHTVQRQHLMSLGDETIVTIRAHVGFGGSTDRMAASLFPEGRYVLWHTTRRGDWLWADFDEIEIPYANTAPLRYSCFSFNQRVVSVIATGDAPQLAEQSIYLLENKARLLLDFAAQRVRFGVVPYNSKRLMISFLDTEGNVVASQDVKDRQWIDETAHQSPFAQIDFDGPAYLDNIAIFPARPLGRDNVQGEDHTSLKNWYVSASSCRITGEFAPSETTSSTVVIRRDPEEAADITVHYFIPRERVIPGQISLTLQGNEGYQQVASVVACYLGASVETSKRKVRNTVIVDSNEHTVLLDGASEGERLGFISVTQRTGRAHTVVYHDLSLTAFST